MRSGLLVLIAPLVLGLLVGCNSGMSEDELQEATQPLVDAHEELRDFQFRIEGGLTYGDTIEDWPDVSSRVRRALEDWEAPVEEGHADADDIGDYAFMLASTHDAWLETVQAIGDFIRDDAPEADIGQKYEAAQREMNRLDEARDRALEPGDQEP